MTSFKDGFEVVDVSLSFWQGSVYLHHEVMAQDVLTAAAGIGAALVWIAYQEWRGENHA